MLLEGMHIPLTTPFFPDGRLNLRKLEQNVARYSLTPVAGMVVLGATGEPTLLSDEETIATLKSAIGAASATKVMIAGTSRNSVHGTLDLLETASALHYDAALIHPPTLPGMQEREQILFLQAVADRSALPLIFEGALSIALISELATHPKVIGYVNNSAQAEKNHHLLSKITGIKRSVTVTPVFSAVTERMRMDITKDSLLSADKLTAGTALVTSGQEKTALKTRTKEVGFQLLGGETERMLSDLIAGAVGAILPFSAAAPQACYEAMAAWKDGDPALAEEKQQRVKEAARRIEGHFGVRGLKYGCDLNGYYGGTPRLPLLPVTAREQAEIAEWMAGMKS